MHTIVMRVCVCVYVVGSHCEGIFMVHRYMETPLAQRASLLEPPSSGSFRCRKAWRRALRRHSPRPTRRTHSSSPAGCAVETHARARGVKRVRWVRTHESQVKDAVSNQSSITHHSFLLPQSNPSFHLSLHTGLLEFSVVMGLSVFQKHSC